MNDILIEYERLYYMASILVCVVGFLTCFCIALIGLFFRKRQPEPVDKHEPEPVDWPMLRTYVPEQLPQFTRARRN